MEKFFDTNTIASLSVEKNNTEEITDPFLEDNMNPVTADYMYVMLGLAIIALATFVFCSIKLIKQKRDI